MLNISTLEFPKFFVTRVLLWYSFSFYMSVIQLDIKVTNVPLLKIQNNEKD